MPDGLAIQVGGLKTLPVGGLKTSQVGGLKSSPRFTTVTVPDGLEPNPIHDGHRARRIGPDSRRSWQPDGFATQVGGLKSSQSAYFKRRYDITIITLNTASQNQPVMTRPLYDIVLHTTVGGVSKLCNRERTYAPCAHHHTSSIVKFYRASQRAPSR